MIRKCIKIARTWQVLHSVFDYYTLCAYEHVQNWNQRCATFFFSYPANIISSCIFVFASTSVGEFLLTRYAPAFPIVRLYFLKDVLRTFGIFTDMVIILKISQVIRTILNTNIVNQKINSCLLKAEKN